jgi:hypothetical protein
MDLEYCTKMQWAAIVSFGGDYQLFMPKIITNTDTADSPTDLLQPRAILVAQVGLEEGKC